MSEELHKTDENIAKKTKQPEVDVEALVARLEKLEGSNNRLLEESKTWKSKYRTLSGDVEAREKAELEKTENWKDLLEIEKNKRAEYEMQLKDTKKSVLQKELGFKVASFAKDAHDVNDVISSLPKDLLSIDEESLAVSGVSEAVNHVREHKPWLFMKEQKSGMSSARPHGQPEKKTYENSSADEKDAMFRAALEGLIS